MKKPQREDNAAEPSQPRASLPEQGSFGTWLRRQREVRDITLREIADDSKISLRYLQALEEDRFDILPAAVFAKGFLRHYARYVGLDPEDVVNYYLMARQTSQPSEQKDEPRRRRPPNPAWRWGWLFVVVVALLLGVVAVLSYLAEQRREALPEIPPGEVAPVVPQPAETQPTETPPAETPPAETPQAGTPTEGGTPPEPPAAVPVSEAAPGTGAPTPASETGTEPVAPLRVSLQFDDECWVEVSVDGRRRLAETRVQGETLELEAQQEIRLTLGDAGAARIEVNGAPYDHGGGPGDVLRDLRITLPATGQLTTEPKPRGRS